MAVRRLLLATPLYALLPQRSIHVYIHTLPPPPQWSKQNASADAEFQKLHASMDFKACPKCGNACQKISGCNHVACAKVRVVCVCVLGGGNGFYFSI